MQKDPLHRRSVRIKEHDYGSAGAYFVTVVTGHREPLFGSITEGAVLLSAAGHLAAREWERLPIRFPSVALDAFLLMPNHLHGIVLLSETSIETAEMLRHTGNRIDDRVTLRRLRRAEGFGRPVTGSLPTIVRSYKSAVALRMGRLCGIPGADVWQRNYYEHVIRDEADLERIRFYIQENPGSWALDHENPSQGHRSIRRGTAMVLDS